MKNKLIALIIAFGSVSTVAAHPGHGLAGGSYGFMHYLTEPDHGLGALALLVLGIVVVRQTRK